MRNILRKTAVALTFTLGFASASSPVSATAAHAVAMTPQLVHPVDPHAHVIVSPDGRLAAALHRGSIYVWDVQSGAILRTLTPAGAPWFAFSNDSQRIHLVIMSVAQGKGALLSGEWHLQTGELFQKAGPAGIFLGAVVPDGKYAILGESPSGTLHVFDLEKNKIIRSFGTPPPTGAPAHQFDTRSIQRLAVSAKGDVALLTRANGSVELWDVENAKQRYEIKQKYTTNWLGISTDGTRAAYVRFGETTGTTQVDVLDAASGKLVRTLSVGNDVMGGLALSSNGKTLVTVSARGAFHQWNVDTGAEAHAGSMDAPQSIETLTFVGPNQLLRAGMQRLELWNLEPFKKSASLVADKAPVITLSSAALTPAPDHAFTTGMLGPSLRLFSWDLTNLGLRETSIQSTLKLKLAANGSRAWTHETNGFKVLDLQTGHERSIMRDTGTTVGSEFIVSGNGQKLIVGGQRRGSDVMTNRTWTEIVVSTWDAESGAKIDKVIRARSDLSQSVVATSLDGRFVVTNDFDGASKRREIHVWDLHTDSLLQTYDVTKTDHVVATLSSHGQSLALAFMETGKPGSHTVQIIDVPTGKVRTTMTSNVVGLVQAMAFSPNADKLALGAVTVEVFYSSMGTLAHSFGGDTQGVTSVGFSADGKYLFTAGQGGALTIHRLDKPASVTMVTSNDEWLVYDEDGYFDASRRGGALVAAVDGLRAHPIDQLAVRNNRPDLLLERMALGDADMIRHFRSRYERRLEKLGISNEALLPSFRTTPEVTLAAVEVAGGMATVKFDVQARGADLLRYNVFVNDVPLFGSLGKTTSGQTQHIEERIELSSGRNKIEVSALDARGGESLRAARVVERNDAVRGDLYYLAFGVSKYKNPKYNLGYPHKDVTDLGDVLRAGAGKTFGHVHVQTYVNERATVDNIRQAKDFLKSATVDDTVVLFIAGHGLHAPDAQADYYFATHEVDPKRLAETAAKFELVEGLLADIRPRKKLFLMDTCESGERDKEDAPSGGLPAAQRSLVARSGRALELDVARVNLPQETSVPKRKYYDRERYIYNDLTRRTGAIVLSSSRGAEFSYELEELANGVFTEELLLALTTDRADRDRDGMVSTDELRVHLGQAVPKRTDDQQHPTVDRDNLDARFGFPIVKEAASIVERTVLPVQAQEVADKPSVVQDKVPAVTTGPRGRGCGCAVAERNDVGFGAVVALGVVGLWRRGRRRVRGF